MLTTTPKRNPASKGNGSDTVFDRLRCIRRLGESYSDVLLRLAGRASRPSAPGGPPAGLCASRRNSPRTSVACHCSGWLPLIGYHARLRYACDRRRVR
jgi:hypothetical protein